MGIRKIYHAHSPHGAWVCLVGLESTHALRTPPNGQKLRPDTQPRNLDPTGALCIPSCPKGGRPLCNFAKGNSLGGGAILLWVEEEDDVAVVARARRHVGNLSARHSRA